MATKQANVKRANVLGVGVSATHLAEATCLVMDGVADGVHGYVTLAGVHGVMEANDDPALKNIFNDAWMSMPDGVPMVWVGKLQGHRRMGRVYGPDLMLSVFGASRDGAVRHFLYGGNDGVAEALKARLEDRFPGVCICGTYTPPFRPLTADEETELIRQVETARADLLWVGISTPKQERFMATMLGRMPVKLMLGVGAAFDFHTGRVRQAPKWIQKNGLEWLFRLTQEPKRLWKRYLYSVPRFLICIVLQFSGLKPYSLRR